MFRASRGARRVHLSLAILNLLNHTFSLQLQIFLTSPRFSLYQMRRVVLPQNFKFLRNVVAEAP